MQAKEEESKDSAKPSASFMDDEDWTPALQQNKDDEVDWEPEPKKRKGTVQTSGFPIINFAYLANMLFIFLPTKITRYQLIKLLFDLLKFILKIRILES